MFIRSADFLPRKGAGAIPVLALVAIAGFAISSKGNGADGYPSKFSFGEIASEQDIASIAIAVSADGNGLPPGSGDYAKGKQVYETACAACHGADLKGVVGLPDMPSGAALRLVGGRGTLTSQKPIVTVESYWPYATTLFDYIRRAMPYTAPGSLSTDEIYAVSAYILAEGKIIDKSAVLDANSLPKVDMPNRDGFIADPRPEMFK
jgi:S-disulfanyl-L-cysteine oxidoreductase SoxD